MNPVAQEIKTAVDAADKSLLPVKFKPLRERHRK
jgi:hypothetical protein